MTDKASSWSDIMNALPAARAAIAKDIAARIAAGEAIARVEGDQIIASQSPRIDLAARRQRLLDEHAQNGASRKNPDRKSAA